MDEQALTPRTERAVASEILSVGKINSMLYDIAEKMGENPAILETADYHDWWAKTKADMDTHEAEWHEAYSHGLMIPLKGKFGESGREQDMGFAERFSALARREGVVGAYLELETDFLRDDPKGIERKFGASYPEPITLPHRRNAQSLALKVLAFTQLRDELKAQGHTLPVNPVLQEAIEAVQLATAKAVNEHEPAKLEGTQPVLLDAAAVSEEERLKRA